MDDFGFYNIEEEKTYIGDIPIIIMEPKGPGKDLATIVLYHGWSSNKETQRIRGFILSSVGYRVIIPDSINHGERNPLSEYTLDAAERLWTTALSSIDEWPILIDGLVERYNINRDKLGVIGNSMGGMIASGIYTHNDNLKALVVLNGSMAWENTNNISKGEIDIVMTEKLEKIEDRVKTLDPINKQDLLVDRPILLLHGDCDQVVSVESQRLFYRTIKDKYKDKEKIKLVEYPGLNHLVTTNMMEEAILFFNKYL